MKSHLHSFRKTNDTMNRNFGEYTMDMKLEKIKIDEAEKLWKIKDIRFSFLFCSFFKH
mgnify:CR=1 FL=1